MPRVLAAAGQRLASHTHHAGDVPWIGLIAITALSLGLLVALLVLVNRPKSGRLSRGRSEQDAQLDATTSGPDADAEPMWWSQFERDFAAYVAKRKSARFGRRSGHDAGRGER
jgi:hypothetical protein